MQSWRMNTRLSPPEIGSLGAAAALDGNHYATGRADVESRTAEQPKWDLLLLSVAGYILTAVGRVHQLFPVLELLHPALLTGSLAIVFYALDTQEERRLNRVLVPTSKLL